MTPFQKELFSRLSEITRAFLIGGAVRDQILNLKAKDVDVVTELGLDELEQLLEQWGYKPFRIGAKFQTVSVFHEGERIDFAELIHDLETDALRRDFTINAIYFDIQSKEWVDPLGGIKDLREKCLRACGSPVDRIKEDPLRIIRMVRFKVKYQFDIDEELLQAARTSIGLLDDVASERITEELGRIMVLEDVEEAVRLLDDIGYWQAYLPEFARLKGLVQNQYHSKDAWEHTLHVVRNTPPKILLRFAGLFHDLGKWETASRECYVWGKLEGSGRDYHLEKFEILGKNLQRWRGQYVEVHGARLDHYPEKIQVKHIRQSSMRKNSFEWVVDGKRHFLGHEKESARLVQRILPRFRFPMILGAGPSGEKELLWLIENHMSVTLAFMSELRGESNVNQLHHKIRRFAWEKGWDGREYQKERLLNLLELWRADFFGGKQRTPQDELIFEKLQKDIIVAAQFLEKRKQELNWGVFENFLREKNVKGKDIGEFKEIILETVMLNEKNQPENLALLEKEYQKFRRR
ncbi:CCA tRNA nucleotidyltransferase [Desulfitobacterium sp. AusDCA]|uniref:CCA tRNA nucleotidyltransferase n=1 Tax=Desulfitobacterium sp. AusDCA TaxID=3240383 RepID=UPI003DA73E16